MCRLTERGGEYTMQVLYGKGKTPPAWEESGWTKPAPQLPALEIELSDIDAFAQKVACQHYIIAYGDNRNQIRELCYVLGIGYMEI